jgi:hypothetical protein
MIDELKLMKVAEKITSIVNKERFFMLLYNEM